MNYAYFASVMKDGSTYKVWYAGRGADSKYRIYYATSSDGLNWVKYNNVTATNSDTISTDGRIGLGTDGTGDDSYIYAPSVIKDGSTYKMWYTGHDGVTTRIYHATSPDGLTWTKYDNSIPDASDTTSTLGRVPIGINGGDRTAVYAPCVIKEGLVQEGYTYRMWYAGGDGSSYRIYHATCQQPPVPCTIFYSY